MDRATEIELIKEVIGLADQKMAYLDDEITHSPIMRYMSPERFDREHAAIFRRKPIIACLSQDIAEYGAFIAKKVMGLPLILARDKTGKAQAFINVCRHRGAKLEREEKGCKHVFTCPYHGWSWTNTGDLRAVPHEKQGFPDLPRAERGLRRVPVAEAHGFIWIIADPDNNAPLDIDAWLGPLAQDFDWLDLANHEIAVENTIEIKANWKTLVEGGIEAYHFRVAHKNTIAPYFPDNLSTYRMLGSHMRSVLPRVTMPDLRDVPKEEWSMRDHANILYGVFPTSQFLVQQDHIVWITMEPNAVDRTTARLVTLVPKTANKPKEYWQKNHEITVATLIEDFDLGEEIQEGFASRGNPTHILGRFEGALNRFNLMVEEMLA